MLTTQQDENGYIIMDGSNPIGVIQGSKGKWVAMLPGQATFKSKKTINEALSLVEDHVTASPNVSRETSPVTPALEGFGQVQMVPWSSLFISPLNPRKEVNMPKLEELAQSIQSLGLLQNLVARPAPDGRIEIASGQRRYLAIGLLVARGFSPENLVPVDVRELTNTELLQIATTENMQREGMSPWEEAQGFADLTKLGMSPNEISIRTGKNRLTVDRRLALAKNLSPAAVSLLNDHKITLEQAQALCLGTLEQQTAITFGRTDFKNLKASSIRNGFTRGQIDLAFAAPGFDHSQLDPEDIHEDLFAGKSYTQNRPEFLRLQREALQGEGVVIVEHSGDYDIAENYQVSNDDTQAETVITIDTRTGKALTYTGMVYTQQNKGNLEEPNEWSPKILSEAHGLKTLVLQDNVANDPYTFFVVLIMSLLESKTMGFQQTRKLTGSHFRVSPVLSLWLDDFKAFLTTRRGLALPILKANLEEEFMTRLMTLEISSLQAFAMALVASHVTTTDAPTKQGDTNFAFMLSSIANTQFAIRGSKKLLELFKPHQLINLADRLGLEREENITKGTLIKKILKQNPDLSQQLEIFRIEENEL